MRILLAEDNEFNQDLAQRILTRRGHEVTLAADGARAVELYSAGPQSFDLVLMDLHMPRLSGHDAAHAIRTFEVGRGTRVPILAMSASAERPEIEHALEMGMDGHIAKPIDIDAMLAAIARAVGPDPRDEDVTAAHRPIRWDEALALVGGDEQLLARVARIFLKGEVRMMKAIRAAVAAGDAPALEEAAHKLRGALGNFTAGSAYESAKRLEALGASTDMGASSEALAHLDEEMGVIRAEIAGHLAGD